MNPPFIELEDEDGQLHTPEFFPRPDGTTYVCGLSSQQPLPPDPSEVGPEAGAPEGLRAMTGLYAPTVADAPILTVQACYRPVTQDGLPLLGKIGKLENAYIATGHSVWGVLNAPATGEAMAELIIEGRTSSVDISPFDPARLPPQRVNLLGVYPRDVRSTARARRNAGACRPYRIPTG